MEVTDDKYSMNDGTSLEVTDLNSTQQTDWGQREVDRNTCRTDGSQVTQGGVAHTNKFWY